MPTIQFDKWNALLKEKQIRFISYCTKKDGSRDTRHFNGVCLCCGTKQVFDMYTLKNTKIPCTECADAVKLGILPENYTPGMKVDVNKLSPLGGNFRITGISASADSGIMIGLRCTKCLNSGKMRLSDIKKIGPDNLKCTKCGSRSYTDRYMSIKSETPDNNTDFNKIIEDAIATQNVTVLSRYGSFSRYSLSIADGNSIHTENDVTGFIPRKTLGLKIDNIGLTLGTLTVEAIYIKGLPDDARANIRYVCKCSKCNSYVIASYNGLKVTKKAKCDACKISNRINQGIVSDSAVARSLIKTYHNNSLVLSSSLVDGTLILDMRCKYHKKNIYKVAYGDLKADLPSSWCPLCMKENKQIDFACACPSCGKYIGKKSVKMIYGKPKDDRIRCSSCGKMLYTDQLMAISDKNNQWMDALNRYNGKNYGFRGIDRQSEVARYCMAYVGRDGKPRYNCYCLKHNQDLILTDEEIERYNHKYCDCEESKFLCRIPTKIPGTVDHIEEEELDKFRE